MRVHDLPANLRPRERLARHGAGSLSDAELLALILTNGVEGRSAIEVANELLRTPLHRLARARTGELTRHPGIGRAKAAQLIAIFELARRMASERPEGAMLIRGAADVVQLFAPQLAHLDREHLIALYLNTRNEVVAEETISIGTVNSSILHPREVFKPALLESAAGLILIHNHPSGDPEPSEADIAASEQIAASGELLGIPLIDHIILGHERHVSMKERGLV